MNPKMVKQRRIKEIEELLGTFCRKYLDEELTIYVKDLWEQLCRKRSCDITKGKKEIWASAIVCVIARLNFLFYQKHPNYFPIDKILNHFGTKRGMVKVRAAEIEKICKITFGHEGLCNPDISDHILFVTLPGGMIILKTIAKRKGII